MSQLTIQQAFELAQQHQQSGRLHDAQQFYQQVLAEQPAHAGALHCLGVVAHQQGQNGVAVDLIRRAIALNPELPEAHKDLATALRKAGQFDEAIAACGQAIALRPDYAEAHNTLANILKDQGRLDEAIAAYRRAIALRGNFAQAYSGLGSALHAQRKLDEAISAQRQAIQIKPDFAVAHVQLARVLRDKGQLEEALAAYTQAVALMPGWGDFHARRGGLLLEMGRVAEAVAACRRAVELAPAQAFTHRILSQALDKAGDREEAIRSLREAHRLDPASQQITFELAALLGDGSMPSAPIGIVRELFDRYSQGFEDHLVRALQYRGPEQLRTAIQSITSRTDMDVLDLGCGTGLCGVELRPMARRLVGVDLSPGMLERCAEKSIYDELIEGDITQALLPISEQWDLIVAGDVMVYIGDLSGVLPAAAAALRPGGWLAFTLERYDGAGFCLGTSLRYSHSLEYIRELAGRAGLAEVLAQEVTLRFQSKAPVAGWIVVLQKDAETCPV